MVRLRSDYFVLATFVLTITVVLNAFFQKKQFYPTVVYLTKSSSGMAVLYLQAFVVALLIGKVVNKIFFGQLRPVELEHLFERSWYAITETCLAFTVFRDDFSPKFVTMFTFLLFLKCFHWLAEDRVDYMERSPIISVLFHLRIVCLIGILMILDLNFILIAYNHTLVKGASVQLVFGFEYAILFVNLLSTFFKYILHTIDLQSENPWENKGVFMLYGDLVLGFIRVILYFVFMSLMIKIHTFPLFAIRPMYLSLRSFKKTFNDVVMSRRAIRNLNNMYPDVTPEQLANYSDTICIICREEMSSAPGDTSQQIKKLPCDHIFHKNCLRSWFQRQQTCPTCRTTVLRLNQAHLNNQLPNQPPQTPPPQQQQAQGAPSQPQTPFANQQAGGTSSANIHSSPNRTLSSSATFLISPDQPQAQNIFNSNNRFLTNPLSVPGFLAPPLPPFAFMPPPLPPLNIPPSLTDAELAEMEGNERHNVEARIHCLRNISTLLNASMTQMQQYMNICAATSHLENITRTRNPVTNIANDLKHIDSKLTHLTQMSKKTSSNQTFTQENNPTTSTTLADSTSDNKNVNPFDTLMSKEDEHFDSSENNDMQTEILTEDERKKQEEIRQRRLKHFDIKQ